MLNKIERHRGLSRDTRAYDRLGGSPLRRCGGAGFTTTQPFLNNKLSNQGRGLVAVLITALLFLAPLLRADDRDWINPAGGAFNNPANWLNGLVPGADDTARFQLARTVPYTVTLNNSPTSQWLVVSPDNVRLQLHGAARTNDTGDAEAAASTSPVGLYQGRVRFGLATRVHRPMWGQA